MSRKILITGGSGFVGANLAQYLLTNTSDSVRLLSRSFPSTVLDYITADDLQKKRLSIVKADLNDRNKIEEAVKDADTIIHTAALVRTEPSQGVIPMLETNIVGSTILFEAALKYKTKRIITLSTAAVYGNTTQNKAIDENASINPVNIYGITKLTVDMIAHNFYITNNLPITILRPFNIYGPFQKPPLVIAAFITKLLKNEVITLNNGGEQTRDWLYIEDLISAITLLIETPSEKINGQIFNVCSGEEISIKEVASMILQKLQKNKNLLDIQPLQHPEVQSSVGDYHKIKDTLNWKPQHSFAEGLQKTIEWYQKTILS